MRPRHKAAENQRRGGDRVEIAGAASMRPRHKAAENVILDLAGLILGAASMRPRHKAAENATKPEAL